MHYGNYIKSLNSAMKNGDLDSVIKLLNLGLFIKKLKTEPLLFTAVQYSQPTIINLLYEKQLADKIIFRKQHIISYACAEGAIECLHQLLCHIPLKSLFDYNMNPLIDACKGSNPLGDYKAVVKLLITEEPEFIDLSINTKRPLTTALIHKRKDLIHLLLDHNAEVDYFDSNDQHILLYAIEMGDVEIINIILERIRFPAHIAAFCGYQPYFEHNCCHNSLNVINNTVIHEAIHGEQVELLQWLINAGYNFNTKNNNGATPLHYAIETENIAILEILLKNGVDPNPQDINGCTPLHGLQYIIIFNTFDKLKLLLNYGADPLIKNNEGVTAKDAILSSKWCSEGIKEFIRNYEPLPDIKEPDDY